MEKEIKMRMKIKIKMEMRDNKTSIGRTSNKFKITLFPRKNPLNMLKNLNFKRHPIRVPNLASNKTLTVSSTRTV